MLKHKTDYIDLGEHYYEKKYKESIKRKLIARAESMGLMLVESPCAATI